MLFDLQSGKRRRVVQVTFAMLAAIFAISFVGFGVGSGGIGGIFDALGLGGDSSNTNPQFQQAIDDAESTLANDPTNTQAMLDLVTNHYAAATSSGVSTDPQTGQTSVTTDARNQLEDAVAAWEDYLKTKPKQPNLSAAANAAQAYVLLGDAGGAAAAQQIVADGQKTAAAYGQLAFYEYADGSLKKGDAAAEKAVAAADKTQRKQIQASLEGLRKRAVKQLAAIKKQAEQGGQQAGEQGLQDPFGGLGGTSGAPAPAPAP